MNLTILTINIILIQGGVMALFFGANVVYPFASRLSSECIKASSSVQNLPPKIAQILKVMTKFKSKEFDEATGSLTDLQHFYNGLQAFLHQYLNFLNEPPSSNPFNMFSLLIYNAQLMESATLQISSASTTFAAVFGINMRNAMRLILSKYSEVITVIRASLEIIKSNFESIVDADTAITVEDLEAELDSQAISDMITAFQEIAIASKQMLLITTGISEITKSLDDITTFAITSSAEKAKASMSSFAFIFNMEVQSARIKFSDEIKGNIQAILRTFGDYSQASLEVFSNTTTPNFLDFMQNQQNKIHDFTSQVTDFLSSIQDEFSKQLLDYYNLMYQSIKDTKMLMAEHAEDLKNYLAQVIVDHSGSSFKNCFNTNSDMQRQAMALMETMQLDFTACAVSERTLASQVESLLTFIVEDITLNLQGAADKLCECSVKGGKKVQEKTMECIMKVRWS